MPTNAQNRKFDTLWSALTFNIYTGEPDSVVLPFLKNHFPYLAKRPEADGWTMYPPGIIPDPQRGMHSLQVDKHPFIKTSHRSATLEFLTQEWNEGPSGIVRTRIWIYFTKKVDAESAYNNIISEFRKIGASIDKLSYRYHKKATIKRPAEGEQCDSLSIILRKKTKHRDYSITILFYDDMGEPWYVNIA